MPPKTLTAREAPPRVMPSGYPAALVAPLAGRTKHPLGDIFSLQKFGVNLTRLSPGAASSLRHAHTAQDEFVYILEGTPTLVTDGGETIMAPGDCAGFPAGTGDAHHLVNRGDAEVVYLEIGCRTSGDATTYPDDDLAGRMAPHGAWVYSRKDGTPL